MSIHEHAAHGNVAGVERALADGVSVDEREPGYGHTPLMAAAASPRAGVAMARLLVERGPMSTHEAGRRRQRPRTSLRRRPRI